MTATVMIVGMPPMAISDGRHFGARGRRRPYDGCVTKMSKGSKCAVRAPSVKPLTMRLANGAAPAGETNRGALFDLRHRVYCLSGRRRNKVHKRSCRVEWRLL
jgi:hypothetical protein